MGRADPTRKRAGARKLSPALVTAVDAARGKKAVETVVLDLRRAAAFTDYFLICSGRSVRQVKAIAEAVDVALRASGLKPTLVEGYDRAEWILMDYFDFVVHIFTPDTRRFYALERLWGNAERHEFSEPDEPTEGGRRP